MIRSVLAVVAAAGVLAGCGAQDDAAAPEPTPAPSPSPVQPAAGQDAPEVVAVTPRRVDGDVWSLEVTLRSPGDDPARYADGWRVLAPDGTVLGEQVLPFADTGSEPVTRTQPHVRIPEGLSEVTVEPSDSASGYGGTSLTVPLG